VGHHLHHHGQGAPLRNWLQTIGRMEEGMCECGVAQNAAHLLRYTRVGDGRGRRRGQAQSGVGRFRSSYGVVFTVYVVTTE